MATAFLTSAVHVVAARADEHVSRGLVQAASEARAALPEILDRVLAGEEVTITRHGEAVAVVVRPDTIRVRRADRALADAERLRELIDRGRASRLSDAPDMTVERAEQLVAEVAAARSAR